MSTAIKVQDITKKYGSRTVLNHVTFEAHTGEVFGLLGPNGAGKTTLIKIITGLLYIEEGSIEICGHDLEHQFENAMAEIGAIVENPEMYKYLTGWQNLLQFARIRGKIDEARLHQVVELVGLTNRINEKVGKYSLGMRQRLGVALALLHHPKVLILDEPTNGLDPAGIKQLRDIVTQVAHKENVCVLVSSHLMSEMELMCDRVCIIENGNVIRIDSLEHLTQTGSDETITYEFQVSDASGIEAMVTSAGMNLSITEIDSTHFQVQYPADTAKEAASTMAKLLIENGHSLYEMAPKNAQNLEEAFIKITGNGGNQIA